LIPRWHITGGELFELARPVSFALSALISTWVLASARRRGFAFYMVAAWTLGTLFFPLILLPIYLLVCLLRRRPQRAAHSTKQEEENAAPFDEPAQDSLHPHARLRLLLPPLYLLAVLSFGALYYYQEAQSVDAHLARANRARLLDQHERAIDEYRAALKLEENAHTRNLLGVELVAANRLEEALAEFRAAERAGEADDDLPYRIANTLDALGRSSEAVPEYQKFLKTRRCTAEYPDPWCAAASARAGNKLSR
jgi:tetratricopeptide (TPR) repeat protein